MKVSTVLLAASGALLVGAAYGIYKYYQNPNVNTTIKKNSTNEDKKTVVPDLRKVHSNAEEIILSEFEETQHETSNLIKERHNMASQHLKETLEEMVSDNLKFDKTIDQVNDDLNDLLK